jgi:hypothetical protein
LANADILADGGVGVVALAATLVANTSSAISAAASSCIAGMACMRIEQKRQEVCREPAGWPRLLARGALGGWASGQRSWA